MKIGKILLTLAASGLFLAGCANKEAIITVNDEAITRAQYESLYGKAINNPQMKQMGIDISKNESNLMTLMIKDRIINELILKTLINQELKAKNIIVTDSEVEAEIVNIIDKMGSKEQLDEMLKQSGTSTSQFKKDLKFEMEVNKLVDSSSKVNITDKDTKDFYTQNKAQFVTPEMVKASHILINANKDEIKEAIVADDKAGKLSAAEIEAKVNEEIAKRKSKAQELLNTLKKDTSKFAELAKVNSQDSISAQNGGDLGFFRKSDMVPEFANAAFALQPGKLSEVVLSPFGFHIILVTDKTKAGVQTYEQVKNDIKAFMEQQARVQALQNLIDGLRNNAQIVFVDQQFSPENIQKEIRDKAAQNPMLQQQMMLEEQAKKEAEKKAQN